MNDHSKLLAELDDVFAKAKQGEGMVDMDVALSTSYDATTASAHMLPADSWNAGFAFMMHLQEMANDTDSVISDLTDSEIRQYWKRWKNEFLPALTKPHHGDCVKAPCSCVRCYVEDKLKESKRILEIIS